MNSDTSPNASPEQPLAGNDRISHEPGKTQGIFAKVELIAVTPSGEKIPLSAAIGAPYITLDGFWRVPIRIRGFGDPSPEIYGIDSMQALHLAIEKIRKGLSSLAASGNRLTDKEGHEISVEEYFKAK